MSSSSTSSSSSSENFSQFYVTRIKPNIAHYNESNLQELVGRAERIICEAFAFDLRSTLEVGEITVQLDSVMLAMLSYAEQCGGESSQRYVASAILACSKEEEMVKALEALGKTWLFHLLFMFEIANPRSYENYEEEEIASEGLVLRRDGYKCVVTGYLDNLHPMVEPHQVTIELDAARILRWPTHRNEVLNCDNNDDLLSFEILLNYTGLSAKTLAEFHEKLDNPSNTITLQYDVHTGFDRYEWCFLRTKEENVYSVKIYGYPSPPNASTVRFEDQSNKFPLSYRVRRALFEEIVTYDPIVCNQPMDLPNPRYFDIHAAICGILHTSGAGIFFDELFHKYAFEITGDIPDVCSWSELESLMEKETLRVSVDSMFTGS